MPFTGQQNMSMLGGKEEFDVMTIPPDYGARHERAGTSLGEYRSVRRDEVLPRSLYCVQTGPANGQCDHGEAMKLLYVLMTSARYINTFRIRLQTGNIASI